MRNWFPSLFTRSDSVSASHADVSCEPLESRTLMARVEGVDVSQWQGTMNWATTAANNKKFAFVRASRTDLNLDPQFSANMTNAPAAGIVAGPYHRALPQGTNEAGPYTDPITDANRFFNAAGSYMVSGYLRPVLDIEDGETLGKTALSQWVNDFCNEIARLSGGVQPVIYCNTNFATNYLDSTVSAGRDLWLANWSTAYGDPVNGTGNPPTGVWGAGNWDFWQYSSTGSGAALGASSANIDLDVFNGGDLTVLKANFQIGYAGAITGSVFHDTNGNGALNSGEVLVAGRTVYIDADNDSVLDAGERSVVTGADGRYTFSGVAPGTYTVRQVVPAGWYQTVPAANGGRTATVTSGATTSLFSFGTAQYARISGSVFNDANGNGVRNTGEAGLSNWTIYIDLDNDSVMDANETRVVSDASGNYAFTNLKTGTYVVRIVTKPTHTTTTPAGGAYTFTLNSGTNVTTALFGERPIA